MIQLRFPQHRFRLRRQEGKEQVFDPIRKRWVALTPEEWVRQHLVQYLLQVKQYPAALVAVEKQLVLGELTKRFDILVFDRQHQPWLMVECKGADITLNDDTLHQLLRYNLAMPVPYLVVSNGINTVVYERGVDGLKMMEEVPEYGC